MECETNTRPPRFLLDEKITKYPQYHQCLENTTGILTKGVVRHHHHVLVGGALVLVHLLHAEARDGGLQGKMTGVMKIGETMSVMEIEETMTTDTRVMRRGTTVHGENMSMNDLADVKV
jgi:hypothetical protein